jgi:tripartite-type tricarboxylate transporter receptor subunit TctC
MPNAWASSGNRPTKLMVGAPAGGTTDYVARALAQSLSPLLDTQVVVENRGGAGGNLAAEAVAKAAPDGATLLVCFTSHTINPSLFARLPFDSLRDFSPISLLASSPSMLVAHPASGISNMRELISTARTQPNKLNFAVGALGSSLHLAGDLFKTMAQVSITNIPYKGTAPALTDVLAGQVPLMFAALGSVDQHVRSGRLRALGVTSAARHAGFADVPTIAETLPGYESSAWFGLLGPARMSATLVSNIADASAKALASADFKRRLAAEFLEPQAMNPAQFAAFIEKDIAKWAPIVKASGAHPG